MAPETSSFSNIQEYKVVGMMSGTSLDGLDIAYCLFQVKDGRYFFSIEKATTVPYPADWQQRLGRLVNASGIELSQAHIDLGRYMGSEVKKFIHMHQLQPDLLASHGHTIFHQPQKGFSLQIGDGYALMLNSGCRVINNFRSLDIALGGQGAPLVPIGDELLFGRYDFCLNIGGIANVSARHGQQRIAYDICPANMVLNQLSRQLGKEYDEGGKLAAGGTLQPRLLEQLNQLEYYRLPFPKSLGYEWVAEQVFPLLENQPVSYADLLHTFCHHIAQQLRNALKPLAGKQKMSLLATGGGAYNDFLIGLMRQELTPLNITVVVPEKDIIEYKEALVFALLGVLRLRKEVNCLASVTGASRDSCSGQVYENI